MSLEIWLNNISNIQHCNRLRKNFQNKRTEKLMGENTRLTLWIRLFIFMYTDNILGPVST